MVSQLFETNAPTSASLSKSKSAEMRRKINFKDKNFFLNSSATKPSKRASNAFKLYG